jgi:hypothetical protein
LRAISHELTNPKPSGETNGSSGRQRGHPFLQHNLNLAVDRWQPDSCP